MGQLFLMTNLFMKFQNCNFIFVTDARTYIHTRPKQNAPFNFFKVGGIKIAIIYPLIFEGKSRKIWLRENIPFYGI